MPQTNRHTAKPRRLDSPWYETAFNELYPVLYNHRDDASAEEEAAGIIKLMGIPPGGRLLDVCCGAGRHAAALTRLGYDVYGLDLSPYLAAQANRRKDLANRIVRADMQAFPFACVFDAVLNFFTSFGYFEDDAANERVLLEMVRVVKPGGRVVIDHMNRAAVERNLVKEDIETRDGARIRQRRKIAGNRIVKEIEVTYEDGGSANLTENVRLYAPEEMTALLYSAGLRDVKLFGTFDGQEISPTSDRMIALAHKPGG